MMANGHILAMMRPMEMKVSPPPGHTFVETNDGTLTLFSETFQEACHSMAGAKEETLLHYFKGCQILEKLEHTDSLTILEVGFGLGIGFKTTLDHFPKNKKLHFISLELDRELLNWFRAEHPELKLEWKGQLLTSTQDAFTLTIIQGDARVELPKFMEKNSIRWHAIYQDAFSPKKNPTLWTKEWFSFLKEHSGPDTIMSTYSASSSIRKSMVEAGWGLQKGDKFGLKRTSTRAFLNRQTDPEILLQLERSPAGAITDKDL
jgi:tRNA U34 5-methylaminomethyl-2-thiouridine-forming methyltransferase MnmC